MSETVYVNLYMPLWQAEFDSDDVGAIGNSVLLYTPEMSESRFYQKSDVWRERWRVDAKLTEPLCIVVGREKGEDQDPNDAIQQHEQEMLEDGHTAVLALRLLRPGWFLSPDLAETGCTCDGLIQRRPGPYRSYEPWNAPQGFQPYKLSIDDLITKPGEEKPAMRIYGALKRHRLSEQVSSFEIAAENYTRSFGLSVNPVQRLTFLFTALDAIYAGMSARNAGPLDLTERFDDRLRQALRVIWPEAKADKETAWMNSNARQMRNAVAHGRPDSIEGVAVAGFPRVMEVVRVSLLVFLGFCEHALNFPGEMRDRLQAPEDLPVMSLFNLALEHAHQGKIDLKTDLGLAIVESFE